MKLWYSTTSPYVRKVRAVARHHQMDDHIQLLKVQSSFSADSPHNQDNPLGRIPALQLDNGQWLYGSSLIAEYLDSIGQRRSLYPDDQTRWEVLNLHSFTDGILENTVAMIAERMMRPENEWWISRHNQIIVRNQRSLKMLESELQKFGTELNIGTLNAVCLIDFLVFRANVTSADLYANLPQLIQWANDMNELYPCLRETKPFVS